MAEKKGGVWGVSLQEVRKVLNDWYLENRRNLPWRQTRDPYCIWISEIILQQTRVKQGYEYYLRFLARFPNVKSLAEASEQEVLRLWQGLGYYSRARNLHWSAQYIMNECGGSFPRHYEQVLQLKGVGPYTAAAICSFAYGQVYAVLDGNVFRFLARYTGCAFPINEGKGQKVFMDLADALLDRETPHDHNQAIMEFGALQCVPGKPDCGSCPLTDSCQALKRDVVELLPVKAKKSKVRDRFLNYFLVKNGNSIYINRRRGRDIWRNLYELPLIESEKIELLSGVRKLVLAKGGSAECMVLELRETVVHKLSHQKLHVQFWGLEGGCVKGLIDESLVVEISELGNYPFPRPIESFLEKEIGI